MNSLPIAIPLQIGPPDRSAFLPPDRASRPGRRGWWLAEGAALFLLVWLLGTRAGVQIPGLDLLWAPVMLLAVRYGYWPGLLAGGAAALATIFPAIADPTWRADLATQPLPLAAGVALLLGGGLLGEIRSAQDRKLATVAAECATARAQLITLEQHFAVIEKAKFELDRRVVGQTRTVAALYDIALALDTLDREAVLPAGLSLLERLFDVKAAALYTADPAGTYRIASRLGHWPGRPSQVVPADAWLAAHQTGRLQVARDERTLAATGALLLLPVRGAGGAVAAIFAVEDIPLSQLTPTNLRLLETIADWTGRAWNRALAHGPCFAATDRNDGPAAGHHAAAA